MIKIEANIIKIIGLAPSDKLNDDGYPVMQEATQETAFPSCNFPENSLLNYFDGTQYLCFETQSEIDDYFKGK